MRLARFVVFGLVLLMTNNYASAMTNEGLYKWCKPFADRAFSADTEGDVLCKAYILGALDYAKGLCFTMGEQAKTDATQAFVRSFFGASKDANTNALIQAYVNKMKNEPNKWEYTPNAALRQVFKELAPCE